MNLGNWKIIVNKEKDRLEYHHLNQNTDKFEIVKKIKAPLKHKLKKKVKKKNEPNTNSNTSKSKPKPKSKSN